MLRTIRRMFSLFSFILAGLGAIALVLALLIAVPVKRPPPLQSLMDEARSVSLAGLPQIERFQARDGSSLAFHRYPVADAKQIAIVIHGSSAAGFAVHTLAKGLAEKGIATYAPDIRGHGASGTRGDIRYGGQLQDDLADLVAHIRKQHTVSPITLIGHSSGGGFALRMAGSPIQGLFSRTILLAPFLGHDAPSSRPDAGGWASPDIPRIIALGLLRSVGLRCCESLPVIGFAVPPELDHLLTATYSFRLLSDFGTSRDFRDDLAAARHKITIYAGGGDSLMLPDKYESAVAGRAKTVILPGISHMGIINDPAAVARISSDLAAGD